MNLWFNFILGAFLLLLSIYDNMFSNNLYWNSLYKIYFPHHTFLSQCAFLKFKYERSFCKEHKSHVDTGSTLNCWWQDRNCTETSCYIFFSCNLCIFYFFLVNGKASWNLRKKLCAFKDVNEASNIFPYLILIWINDLLDFGWFNDFYIFIFSLQLHPCTTHQCVL